MSDDTVHDAELRELAARLGSRAAERLDVDRTAEAVVERLRQEASRAPGLRLPSWLRIAAAVAVLAGGAAVLRQAAWPGNGTPAVAYLAADLEDLSVTELEEVLATLDDALDSDTVRVAEGGLETLNAEELSAVLRSLEG